MLLESLPSVSFQSHAENLLGTTEALENKLWRWNECSPLSFVSGWSLEWDLDGAVVIKKEQSAKSQLERRCGLLDKHFKACGLKSTSDYGL